MGYNDIRNAKNEFLSASRNLKVISANIDSFAYDDEYDDERHTNFILRPLHTKEEYEDFLKFLDHDYDSGYGGQNLHGIVFCEDGYWMARCEYDGAEWWNVYNYPDMREYFDDVDVLKYERSKKLKRIEESF